MLGVGCWIVACSASYSPLLKCSVMLGYMHSCVWPDLVGLCTSDHYVAGSQQILNAWDVSVVGTHYKPITTPYMGISSPLRVYLLICRMHIAGFCTQFHYSQP